MEHRRVQSERISMSFTKDATTSGKEDSIELTEVQQLKRLPFSLSRLFDLRSIGLGRRQRRLLLISQD